jgi:hypothetical protein
MTARTTMTKNDRRMIRPLPAGDSVPLTLAARARARNGLHPATFPVVQHRFPPTAGGGLWPERLPRPWVIERGTERVPSSPCLRSPRSRYWTGSCCQLSKPQFGMSARENLAVRIAVAAFCTGREGRWAAPPPDFWTSRLPMDPVRRSVRTGDRHRRVEAAQGGPSPGHQGDVRSAAVAAHRT